MDAHTAWALIGLLSVAVGFISLISIIYPLKFLRIRTRRQAAILAVLSMVAFGIALAQTPTSPKVTAQPDQGTIVAAATVPAATSQSPVATPSAPAPAQAALQRSISIPADQSAFIAAVEVGRSAYNAGQTDFQKGAARPARAAAICKALGSPAVKNWIGTVTTLTTNGDGKGVLGITIAEDIVVTTWNNSLSDISDNTLVPPGSELFSAMGALKKGDTVRFSGSFVRNSTDCFGEQSLTMRGSMTDPAFTFRFKTADKL